MNENESKLASEVIHEQKIANKRMFVAFIITLFMLFLSNIAWLIAWNLPTYKSETVTVDSIDGNANYIGNDGEITNGESNSTKNDEDKQGGDKATDE